MLILASKINFHIISTVIPPKKNSLINLFKERKKTIYLVPKGKFHYLAIFRFLTYYFAYLTKQFLHLQPISYIAI